MKELMTTADAAALLSVSTKTIRQWLNDGKLSGANIPGAGWRITPADIEAFLSAHRPPAYEKEQAP